MSLFEKVKIWRATGRMLDTKMGAFLAQAIGPSINWMASRGVSTKNDEIPWTPFEKPLSESCLAVVSTAGFYLEGDDPFDVDSMRGDPSFRTIASDCDVKRLRIAHTHYAHARVDEDINVLFPVDRLGELVEANVLGRLAPNFFSFGFMGTLTREVIGRPDGSAHRLVRELKAGDVDCVLLVPA